MGNSKSSSDISGKKNSKSPKKKVISNKSATTKNSNNEKSLSIAGLSEEQYKRLVSQTNLPEYEIKTLIGKFMENNPEQRLGQEQFTELYKSLRHENEEHLDKLAKCVFRVFDRNNNLTIDLREFLIAYALTTRGDMKTRIELAFDLYDVDHNGYLDMAEVTEVVDAMLDLLDSHGDDAQSVAKLCFDGLDTDDDGRISKDEFVDGLLKSHALRVLMNPFS